jgi:hypothetical protein
MRLVKMSTIGIGLLVTLTSTPVFAGQKGRPGNSAPKAIAPQGPSVKPAKAPAPLAKGAPTLAAAGTRPVKTNGRPALPTPQSVKVTPKSAAVSPKSAKATSTSTKTTAKVAKVTSKSAKAAITDTTSPTGRRARRTAARGTTNSTTIDFTGGKAGSKLVKNSALRSKLELRLAAAGYNGTVYQAAWGFKNMGQFVAASNVSRNLGISFEQLKIQMTGLSVAPDGTVLRASVGPDGRVTMVDPALVVTPAPTKSLGQAIQTLKPNADAMGAAQTATLQADAEVRRTSPVAPR